MHLKHEVNDVCVVNASTKKIYIHAKPASVLFIGKCSYFLVVCVFSAAAVLQTRNAVVYDEVVLPPTSTTPSSVIPTEPNTAYVTTQTTTIPTHQNVAYAVHT